jgi:hypothetical protein
VELNDIQARLGVLEEIAEGRRKGQDHERPGPDVTTPGRAGRTNGRG